MTRCCVIWQVCESDAQGQSSLVGNFEGVVVEENIGRGGGGGVEEGLERVGSFLAEVVDKGQRGSAILEKMKKDKKKKKKSKDGHCHKKRRDEVLVAEENVVRDSSSTNACSPIHEGLELAVEENVIRDFLQRMLVALFTRG